MKKTLLLTMLLTLCGITTAWAEFAPEAGKKYALKSPTGTYFNFTASGNTAASFQATPTYFNMIASANGYVFEDWDNSGSYIGLDGNFNVGTTRYVWSVSEADADGYVSISRSDDATKFLGHDTYTNVGTGIYTNVGSKCYKWILEAADIYEDSKPTFTDEIIAIQNNGQYLTTLKLGETTILSAPSAPSSVDDMHVIAEDKGITLEKGGDYTFTLTFPKNQTSQILVANLWLDKDGDCTYETHLGTTGNAKTSNDLTTVSFTIPLDALSCFTRLRFRLDSSWKIAETANAEANRMVYDIPVAITGAYEDSKPKFTNETSDISSNGQYLTTLKLGETTILSALSAPSSVDDMHVIAEDKGITLEKVGNYTFTLTFPKNQTSQILVANLWLDKEGDGTYETHLGTTGNAKVSNDLTTVDFTIPSDALSCFTRLRFRLDSSWNIAEKADTVANRMVYDIPITIIPSSPYKFCILNTPGEAVSVTYDGAAIADGDEIENIDITKFEATSVPGYQWAVVLDTENHTATLTYTKTHYTFQGVNAPDGDDVAVQYGEEAVGEGSLIEIDSYDADLFSATEISGYTWSIVLDDETKTIVLTYSEAPIEENPEAVRALMERIGGEDTADKFKFVLDPSLNSKQEVFVIGSEGGKILIKGSTLSAITTGIGWYLNNYAHINIAWNSLNEKTVSGGAYADLSALPLPTTTETRTSDAKYRYYLNYCTFGYSMTSWTWKRWQQEIDWMALHGINMPLQIVGLEEVWRKFLTLENAKGERKYGYTDEEAKAFVAGPAFTAWWGMNNLEGWGGTGKGELSNTAIDGTICEGTGGVQDDAWYERQQKLATQILERQRELGIEPVLPGFSGMVPTNFTTKTGVATDNNNGEWQSFQRPRIIDPTAERFAEIAADYYACLEDVMGESQYYSMDPFHEGGAISSGKYTEAYKAIYDAMEAAKKGSQWIIQQWHWSNNQKLSLNAVPEGRLIVLDLFSDGRPAFDTYNGYAPQDAVFCAIPNFGGRSGLMGRLQNVTDNYFKFKGQYANIKGIGAAPEAIEQTPVTYDLIFQLPWMGSKPDVKAWVDNYAMARYGANNAVVKEAWDLLRQSVLNYGADGIEGPVEDVWAARPNLDANPASKWGKTLNHAGGTYTKARRQMLIDATYKLLSQEDALGMELGSVYESNYNYDLVEFGGGVMADYAYDLLLGIKAAKNADNTALYEARRAAFLALIEDVDAFKGTNLNFRLGKWTQEARDAAGEVEKATTATPDWYEFNNARTLITTWTYKAHGLNDYSYRSWQGLMKDYYLPRWEYYFKNDCQGPSSYFFFEWNWAHGMEHEVGQTAVSTTRLNEDEAGYSYSREPEGNTVEEAKKMLGKYIIPVVMTDGTYYAYRYLENDLTAKVTIIGASGATIDLTQYFGALQGATVTGDFIQRAESLDEIVVKDEAADGAYTGTLTLADGTVLTFAVVINPAYSGTYHINYNKDPVSVKYHEGGDNGNSIGYKLLAGAEAAEADKIFTITPSGTGYALSVQGKYLQTTVSSKWRHVMFSDNKDEAGVYLFEEAGEQLNLRSTNTQGHPYVTLYSGNVFGNDVEGKASTFTLTEVTSFPLTITEAGMATLCLPFNVVLPAGMKAYDFAATHIEGGDGDYVCAMQPIAEKGDTLKAGTPVIVKADAGNYNLGITMSSQDAVGALPGSLLRGNYVAQTLTQSAAAKKFIFVKGDYGVGFYRMRESGTIGANKCWMEWRVPATIEANVRSLTLRFGSDGGTTTIDEVPVPLPAVDVIYNLAGQRLTAPQKGVNIINGKKVVIK